MVAVAHGAVAAIRERNASFGDNALDAEEEKGGQGEVEEDEEEFVVESLPYQTSLRRLYSSSRVQMLVAACIFVNFIISAIEKQVLPEQGSSAEAAFAGLELAAAIIFGIELAWNIYAHWFTYFWLSYALQSALGKACVSVQRRFA